MLFFWKQNSLCIFSNRKSEGHSYNYIQQQKGSDVMGARQIHPKLYYISPWRLISEAASFLGPCEGVQPLLGFGQHVQLWKSSGEYKLPDTYHSDTVTELLARRWLPSHQLSWGALVSSSGTSQSCVEVSRGLISCFGRSSDFLKSFVFSVHLKASLCCLQTQTSRHQSGERWHLLWSQFPPSECWMLNPLQNGNDTMNKVFYKIRPIFSKA